MGAHKKKIPLMGGVNTCKIVWALHQFMALEINKFLKPAQMVGLKNYHPFFRSGLQQPPLLVLKYKK